jgi:hypothetical protein
MRPWASVAITPKFGGLRQRRLDAGHGDVGAAGRVLGQHHRVVHLVDMVAGEDQHLRGPRIPQQVEVLVDGVGGAAVPGLAQALLGRHHVHVLTQVRRQEAPAALDVADQALRLVLRQHGNAADARVHAVAEREVDDLELAGKGHGRLGAPVGELLQARAAPARQHDGQGLLRQVVGAHRAVAIGAGPVIEAMPCVLLHHG